MSLEEVLRIVAILWCRRRIRIPQHAQGGTNVLNKQALRNWTPEAEQSAFRHNQALWTERMDFAEEQEISLSVEGLKL